MDILLWHPVSIAWCLLLVEVWREDLRAECALHSKEDVGFHYGLLATEWQHLLMMIILSCTANIVTPCGGTTMRDSLYWGLMVFQVLCLAWMRWRYELRLSVVLPRYGTPGVSPGVALHLVSISSMPRTSIGRHLSINLQHFSSIAKAQQNWCKESSALSHASNRSIFRTKWR